MQTRLKTQLIVMLLVVGIIPLLVISSLGLKAIQEELREEVSGDVAYYAESFAEQINDEISYWVDILDEYVKTDSGLKQGLIDSNQEFDELGSEEAINNFINEKDLEWISTPREEITPFMQEILSDEISEKLRSKLEFWENTRGHTIFGELFVANKYGANVFQTGKTSDYNQRDEVWWQLGKEREYYLGGIDYDKSADMTSMDIVIRILDDNDNFVGVLKAVLSFDMIKELVAGSSFKDLEIAENMNLIILDSEGTVYFSTHEDYIAEEKLGIEMDEILANKKGYIVSSYSGKSKLMGYSVFGGNQETVDFNGNKKTIDFNGIILIEIEEESAFEPVSNMRSRTSMLSFIFAMAVLLIALAYSSSVSKPIKKLTENVDTITKGNFDVRLGKSNIFEIQNLTGSLNRILASMKLAILRSGLSKEEMGIGKVIRAKNEAEAKFKALFESARDAIFIADSKTKQMVDCNKAAEKLTGYSREKLLSMHSHQLYPKEILEETLAKFKKQIGDEKMIVKTKVLTDDKKTIPVAVSTALVKMGDKSYLQGVFRDITAQVEAEKELRLKDSAIDSSISPVAILDLNGSVTYVNKSFIERWGYKSSKGILGKNIANFLQRKTALQALQTLKIKGKYSDEVMARRTDGSSFVVHLSASIVKDKHGKPIDIMASLLDISKIKKAEQELLESNRIQQEVAQKLKDELARREKVEQERKEYTTQLEKQTTELDLLIAKQGNSKKPKTNKKKRKKGMK